VTIACQLIAGGVPQHVRMDLERKVCFLPCTLDHPIEAIRREWSAAFAHEHEWGLRCFPPELAQRPELIAANGMSARLSALYSADMKRCGVPVDLLPSQVANFRSTQPMQVTRSTSSLEIATAAKCSGRKDGFNKSP
jgi:hypothetical protein